MDKDITQGAAYAAALITSETRHAKLLHASGVRIEKPETYIDASIVRRPRLSFDLSADYYQHLHDDDRAYQENNWLISEEDQIVKLSKGRSIAEIGCGNGQFTKLIADKIKKVYAFDWARSPSLADLPENVRFIQGDIRKTEIPNVDVLCSADVLEHFPPNDLPPLIAKFSAAAKVQHHVIACYDDGHSHLTVMPPSAWLALFWRFSSSSAIHKVECRRNNPKQIICSITASS